MNSKPEPNYRAFEAADALDRTRADRTLASWDAAVIEHRSVIDGEPLARGHVPQLAIVDFQLGNDVAFDLVDHLHDLGVHVIVVSGIAISSPRLANAAAVLQKPFTGQELLGALACATPEPSLAMSMGWVQGDDRGAVAMSTFLKSSQRPVPGVRWQSF